MQLGLIVNALLALIKLVTGLLGNSSALVADAVESTADIFSSVIVLSGLRIASREADEEYPWGYGRAETLAGAVVALMLFGAAVGISIQAIRDIQTPHHAPAPYTLVVLVAVIIVKEMLFRRVAAEGDAVGSTAVKADAWHHRSDALTSAAAFVGISIALWKGWASADDWAALLAAVVIAWNGWRLLRPAVDDLMDRVPDPSLAARILRASTGVDEVRAVEKLRVRRTGMYVYVDLHVQTDPSMSLHDAHIVSGKVKGAIQRAVPNARGVLIHMEPHEPRAL